MNILLTNDDSHDSPLFLLLIEAMAPLGDVHIVVPATEQSWKGKSMTRYGTLYAERIDLHGTPAWSVTGTPADCVNMAIHNLLDVRPDVVVSGINIGTNTGLGFALASGTLGACFEGNIAGIGGLALSQALLPEVYHKWSDERRFEDSVVADLRADLQQTLPEIWQQFVLQHPAHTTTWSINLPVTLTAPEVVHTRLGYTMYGRCFTQRGDQFHHQLSEVSIDEAPDTDLMTLRSGRVSATQIDLRMLGQQMST